MGISAYDTINYANFNPLSMQEIFTPAAQMREQHDKLQEEYAAQEAAGGLASLGLQEGVDDIAIASQKAYMDSVKNAADELATKGFVDAGRRKSLIGLKQQYVQNVLPIQNALKVRQEAIDFDRKMKASDQTYKTTFDPSRVAVTDYLKNNQAFNPQGVSVGVMSKDAANEFAQLKNLVSQKYPTIAQSGVIGTLWTKVNSGVSLDEITGFIKNEAANKNIDAKALSALGQEMHNIVENNLQKHGAYKAFGNDPKAINELRSSVANMAIYSLGEPKFGQMNDPMAIFNAQQRQQQNQIDYAPTDVDEDPEITDSDKYNKVNKDLSVLKNLLKNGKYTPSSHYKNSKEFVEYEKAVAENQRQRDKNPNQNTMTGYGIGVRPPSNYYEYQKSKQIESIARKYGINNFEKLQQKLEGDLENMRKMSKTMWVDDNKDVAKKHYLQNIISNKTQSKKFEDEIGMTPQEVINDPKKLELLRFGINPRKGLFAQYSESPTKHKKVSLDYGMSGNSYSSTDSRINDAYNNAFEGKLTGDDLLSTGHFKRVKGGYETATLSDRNGNPVFISEENIKRGLDDEVLGFLFDKILTKVYTRNSSYARASVDAQPTKVGGGR